MLANDLRTALCNAVALAQGGDRSRGPFAALAGGGGLKINTGGGGTFFTDADLAALEAAGYVVVSRDRQGDGRLTILQRAVDECAGR